MFDPVHVQCELPPRVGSPDVPLLNRLATHLNENQSKAAGLFSPFFAFTIYNGLFITEFDLKTLANMLQSPTELSIKKMGNQSAVC